MNFELFFCFLFTIKLSSCKAQFENTVGPCYFGRGTAIRGDLITQIFISGNSTEKQLETCCSMCRALPNCVAYHVEVAKLNCQFFKAINNIFSSKNHLSGSNTIMPFWNCNVEVHDRWYFESDLWTVQSNATSKASLVGCCHDCYWSSINSKCVSWMYNEITEECFHSTKPYNKTISKSFIGIYTGSVSKSFSSII